MPFPAMQSKSVMPTKTKIVACPGLQASWINGCLAAVGATALDSRVRLHWSTGAAPVAVLSARGEDPVSILRRSWPTRSDLQELPIAETWGGTGQLKRRVNVDEFKARVRVARSHRYSWTLSSTLTDLCVDKNGEVAHARFDPAGPGTIKWLHHRLLKVHKEIDQISEEHLLAAFENRAPRINDNGLGFDQTRLGSLADKSNMFVDPVVEVLAFHGIGILPVRGSGMEGDSAAVQRGWLRWSKGERRNEGRTFLWPAWEQPLDIFGIDALLDAWVKSYRNSTWKKSWPRLGIHAGWRLVSYEPRGGSADRTRGFASEVL